MMKGNFLRYFLVMMIAILASSACYAQTNQGYSKKKTVTTKTVSRSRSSKKHKSGSHQSHSSSKQSGNQNYDVPIFNMDEILKKIESQDYIVFLSRTGVVYGFNKNTHKYFTIYSDGDLARDVGFRDSSIGLVIIRTKSGIRFFYYLTTGKIEKEELTQQIVVTGRVYDEQMRPYIGAKVIVKGTNRGTFTDLEGNYSIYASIGETLIFSSGTSQHEEAVYGSNLNVYF